MPGFLLINKPKTWTSHDVVGYLRKITGEKRIGHAGTLDPFATGLLVVGVGREATRQLEKFQRMSKTYVATIELGKISDTQDSTGTISPYKTSRPSFPSKKEIKTVLKRFIGKQEQLPPMYSAKKINGEKLYDLARQGIEVERKKASIEIYNITLKKYEKTNDEAVLVIHVDCSSGTYIRTLAHDIGETLGTGAYCKELSRTRIGKYRLWRSRDPKYFTLKNFRRRLISP